MSFITCQFMFFHVLWVIVQVERGGRVVNGLVSVSVGGRFKSGRCHLVDA